ncbi:MAG: tetratricopeptide repeat protein [bacterium]
MTLKRGYVIKRQLTNSFQGISLSSSIEEYFQKTEALKIRIRNTGNIWIIILAFLFFFSPARLKAKTTPPVNFLLITIDTIRPDHIGCYGYDRIKTPHIDRLAEKGILFENAFSPVPITLPSHTSILTGTYPGFHGIRNNGTYAVSDAAVTLAELLKDEGYATAAFVGAYVLDKRFGLDQGFDVYDDDLSREEEQTFTYKERRAESVTNAVIQWLKERNPSRFFLWVHYFDPHMHYNPPPPFSAEYADRPYDGEIAYTDHWIGVLLDVLHQSGISENTIVILTGDHGEGLGEHQEKTHGIFIYDTTLQVPLIFNCPRLFPRSGRIRSLVRLIDIAPTILSLAGCKINRDMQGVSLLPLINKKDSDLKLILYCESFYPQFSHNWSPLMGLRTSKWKYIQAPIKELYRVEKDHQELKNVFEKEHEQADKLASQLDRLQDRITASRSTKDDQRITLDEKSRERLRSLGYVFTPDLMEGGKDLPDPKEMIGTLASMDEGLAYFGKGEYGKARDQFLKILEKSPNDADTHTILGHAYEAMGDLEKSTASFKKALDLGCKDLRIYIKLGSLYMKQKRFKEGIDTFREALAINPGCKEALMNIAGYHLQKGDLDKARTRLQEFLEIDPDDVRANNYLATIHVRQRRYDQAILACRTALETDPNNVSALVVLGSTLLYQHRYPEALDALQRAIRIKPDSPRPHYFAGLVTFQQNQMDQAIGYFEKAVQLDPNWAEPLFNLGFIYQQQKAFKKAIKAYQAALRIKPDLVEAQRMIDRINLQLRHQN